MILIGIPTRDFIAGRTVFDLAQLLKIEILPIFALGEGNNIPANRINLARQAVELKAPLLFIDSDMRFPASTLRYLLSHDKPIIGANCRDRKTGEFTARREHRAISSVGKTGIEAVDTNGFGVMLIQPEVFQKLPEPWFANPYDTRERKPVGEDIYFCTIAHEHGFQVFIDHDLSQHVRHIGAVEFGVEETK